MNNKCLLCVVIIACFQSQVHALPSLLVDDSGFSDSDSVGDPLSASQLGESMDMPLPQELILEAKRAGIIKKSNSYYKSDSEQPGFSLGAQPEKSYDNSMDNINITGLWNFDLDGKYLEQMKLYLLQDKSMIKGSGIIIRANNTLNATANGSILGSKLSLTVALVEIHDIYKLDLSLSSLDSGIYIADLSNGTNRSGKVTFTVSSNIFKSSKDGEQWP